MAFMCQLTIIPVFIMTFLILTPSAIAAENLTDLIPNSTDFDQLDKIALDEIEEKHVPGAALVIVSGDDVVYSRGYGLANIETNQSTTCDTLFRIGSTTKIFTAAALVKLENEGRIDLQLPVGNYITGLSPNISRFTGHQLLSHTAGLVSGGNDYGKHDESGLAEGIRSLNDSVCFTTPGEVYSYSNNGFAIAGLLLEEVGGKPYADMISELLLKPLGMNMTTFRPTEAMTYPISQGYRTNEVGEMDVVRPFNDDTQYWPAGFLFTSANDLARLAIALLNNGTIDEKQVLDPAIISEMETSRAEIPSFLDNRTYGYGLMIHDYRGLRVVEHPGAIDGFSCCFMLVPEYRLAVIVLSNTATAELNRTYEKAFELMLPLQDNTIFPLAVSFNESEMAAFEGDYYQSPTLRITLNKSDFEQYDIRKIGENLLALGYSSENPLVMAMIPGPDGTITYLQMDGKSMKKIK